MVLGTEKMSKAEDFLPYEMGYLTPEMQKIAEEELNETEEARTRCLKEIRELLKRQETKLFLSVDTHNSTMSWEDSEENTLTDDFTSFQMLLRSANEKDLYVRTDDNFLLTFLRGRKFDVEKAFKSIQNYYRFRGDHRSFYCSENNEAVHDVFRKNFIGFLPHRDKEGRVILLIRLGFWDPAEVSRDLYIWTITHCMIHSIEDPATQVLGYTLIMDFNGCGQKLIKILTPQNVMLMIHSTQCCFPGRFKAVHVLGTPKIFSLIYALIYPFLTSKLRKRINIHGNDITSLHKLIPPCILPSEYGGDTGPFNNKPWHDLILSRNEWCLEQRLYGYN